MGNKTPIKAEQNNKPARILSVEELRKLLLSYDFTVAPKTILKSAQKLMGEYDNATGEKKEQALKKLDEKLNESLAIVALDKHHLIANALYDDKHRTLAIEIADQLITEYGCTTTTEKMLAETASWAYCRMLEYSNRLSGITQLDYLSNEKNSYYNALGLNVDRANRQFLSAISLLRQIKQPKVNITFKAHNAFVAQNQQINAPQGSTLTEKNNEG
jgi:hypothetical protein